MRQEVGLGNEVGVENGDELALRDPQAGFVERAGFVARPIGPVDVLDVDALRGEAAHGQLGDFPGFVGRIVEHLNFEQIPRILDPADRLDQPFDDIHFVVQRKLDRDRRQRLEVTRAGPGAGPCASCTSTQGSSGATRKQPG